MTWQNSILFSSQGIFDMHGIPVFRHGPAGNGNPHFLQLLGDQPVAEGLFLFFLIYDAADAAFYVICRILFSALSLDPHRKKEGKGISPPGALKVFSLNAAADSGGMDSHFLCNFPLGQRLQKSFPVPKKVLLPLHDLL